MVDNVHLWRRLHNNFDLKEHAGLADILPSSVQWKKSSSLRRLQSPSRCSSARGAFSAPPHVATLTIFPRMVFTHDLTEVARLPRDIHPTSRNFTLLLTFALGGIICVSGIFFFPGRKWKEISALSPLPSSERSVENRARRSRTRDLTAHSGTTVISSQSDPS